MKKKYNSPQINVALICIEDGIAAGSSADVIVRDPDNLMYEEWETEQKIIDVVL